jgi:hypothetical protein
MKRMEDMTEGELGAMLRDCAKAINSRMSNHCDPHPKPMFALLVFNDPAVAQYISSCRREDVIKAMRECADRLEQNQDIPRSS